MSCSTSPPPPLIPLLLLSSRLAERGERLVGSRRNRHGQPLQAGRPEEQSPQLPHQLPGKYLRQGASLIGTSPPTSFPTPPPTPLQKTETKVHQVFYAASCHLLFHMSAASQGRLSCVKTAGPGNQTFQSKEVPPPPLVLQQQHSIYKLYVPLVIRYLRFSFPSPLTTDSDFSCHSLFSVSSGCSGIWIDPYLLARQKENTSLEHNRPSQNVWHVAILQRFWTNN